MISKLAFLPVLLSFLCALQTQGIYFYPFFFFTKYCIISIFCSVQFSRSVVSDSAIPWTAACQASLSITSSQSPPKPMSIEPVFYVFSGKIFLIANNAFKVIYHNLVKLFSIVSHFSCAKINMLSCYIFLKSTYHYLKLFA